MPTSTPLSAFKHTFLQNHAKNLGPKLKSRVYQPPVFLFKAFMVTIVTIKSLSVKGIPADNVPLDGIVMVKSRLMTSLSLLEVMSRVLRFFNLNTIFVFSRTFILLSRENAITSSLRTLRSCRPSVYNTAR